MSLLCVLKIRMSSFLQMFIGISCLIHLSCPFLAYSESSINITEALNSTLCRTSDLPNDVHVTQQGPVLKLYCPKGLRPLEVDSKGVILPARERIARYACIYGQYTRLEVGRKSGPKFFCADEQSGRCPVLESIWRNVTLILHHVVARVTLNWSGDFKILYCTNGTWFTLEGVDWPEGIVLKGNQSQPLTVIAKPKFHRSRRKKISSKSARSKRILLATHEPTSSLAFETDSAENVVLNSEWEEVLGTGIHMSSTSNSLMPSSEKQNSAAISKYTAHKLSTSDDSSRRRQSFSHYAFYVSFITLLTLLSLVVLLTFASLLYFLYRRHLHNVTLRQTNCKENAIVDVVYDSDEPVIY